MIKKILNLVRRPLSSIRVKLLLVLIVSLSFAVGIYFGARALAFFYIDNVYTSQENRNSRELEYIRQLQSYVNAGNFSSEQTHGIAKWAKEHRYVYLLIYKDDELFYTSDDIVEEPIPEPELPEEPEKPEDVEKPEDTELPEEPENPENSENPEESENPEDPENPEEPEAPEEPEDTEEPIDPDGPESSEKPEDTEDPEDTENSEDAENSEDPDAPGGAEDQEQPPADKEDGEPPKQEKPGGVTVTYPTRAELFEYAQKNDLHPIELSDGTVFASIAEFSEYLYYDIANIASFLAAAVFVIIIITIYAQKISGRIIRLGAHVNKVADGDIDHRISLSGKDELSKLSDNVENMRSSMVENIRKEREAMENNNALITSMSHDIRTPLTVLLGYIEIMRERAGDDEVMQSYIKAAENTAMRLKKLSDDMFGYFLVFGEKKLDLLIEPYHAETLVWQMLSEHVLLMKENGYLIDTDRLFGDALAEVFVLADAQSLIRIFDNVFSNIYKYADKSAEVKITAEVLDGRVKITFVNRISPDKDNVESNGIGQKTCKKLAELMGGGFECGADGDIYCTTVYIEVTDDKLHPIL